jgi:NAD+ diphosphatase
VSDPAPTAPPLARSGVDRAALRRTDPQWLDAAWQRARVVVISPEGRVRCTGDPALVFVEPEAAPPGQRLFLGLDPDGTPYFAVVGDLPDTADAGALAGDGGGRALTLREIGAELTDRDAGLFVTAAALVNWHASHGYSPVTGEATAVTDGGWLRVDATGTQLFPRTDPAVIVVVHDGMAGATGRCLLAHNASWPVHADGRRFYSALAGFVEPGESAEAALTREVYEEVGLDVSDLRYQGSQAWPFPGSLMLGFHAYADPAAPLRLDPSEIADARWLTRAEVAKLFSDQPGVATPEARVTLPGPASIAHYLIRTWLG